MTPKRKDTYSFYTARTGKPDRVTVERLMVRSGTRCECEGDYCEHHEADERCPRNVREVGVIYWPPNIEVTDDSDVLCPTCAENRASSQGFSLFGEK
jgi:hypothetical protein